MVVMKHASGGAGNSLQHPGRPAWFDLLSYTTLKNCSAQRRAGIDVEQRGA